MPATLTFNGRLPGVDCQPALPPAAAAIRLDVTGFVGFAERGPLDTPVAVEDVNQYTAVFGGDLVVASDGGVPVYANLPGAVAAFFDNGGQRCYVVRVAGPEARAARLQLPGMRLYQPDGEPQDVFVRAAWPGTWSDGLGVGAQLLMTPLAATHYIRAQGGKPGKLQLTPAAVRGIGAGDLLQLALGPLLPQLYVSVSTVDAAHGVAAIGTEVPFLTELASPPSVGEAQLLGPDALTGIPPTVPVAGAWLLRFDLIASEVAGETRQLLERWGGQRFNPGPFWADVIQPDGDPAPDLTRSMLLRADPQTAASATTGIFVPVGMDQLGTSAEFADAVPEAPGPSGETDLDGGSNGLATYDSVALFLDRNLLTDSVDSLLTDADQLTVLARKPVRLHGIHALIGIDDVALLSVPDAVHPGWSPAVPGPELTPQRPPLPPPVVWSNFRDCAVAPPVPPSPPAPAPKPVPPDPPSLDPAAGYDLTPLVQVHTAMARMCAARADMVAVLAVPKHFDVAAVRSWEEALTAKAQPSTAGRIVSAPLSFAGFWHPWVQLLETATPQLAPLRPQPPDGVVCGMIAARELARGVWVAPANVPLRGPVALLPPLADADVRQLFDTHANLLRQQPGAFITLSAHTLATDPMLLQVSVRRLLILLRKIAIAEGARYVFDTNTDRFRQLVRMRFERILGLLTSQGAILAFQVVTAGGVNTPDDIDNGRLIVQLQVAPTSPIEFITVSLVRAGESLLDVVVG
jgi:uncharacterized protein